MTQEEEDKYESRLDALQRHIKHVQENCWLLAARILDRDNEGDHRFSHTLVTHAQIHDHSKFKGIEWDYLWDEVKETNQAQYTAAWMQHVRTNEHHPEYWDGIENMPDIFIAEFVCDTNARAGEFGTDYREWVKEKATKRYDFTTNGRVYKKIKEYTDLLLDKPFS